ncbi:DUF6288 domain-containing protein [Roseibacillus ishigakijimensis]|uniref:PDZ domain-containing protein n=1 Tax=Roseibacillus ishigakijimensis TaxID=454146 RepID=A0A934VNU4_9BACT|nr:DUF6288 domain-containing protein [Roseibacillus ishigakijimensis]MBK1835400.1 hypothetical protein [Roseibacillus ishigakijimensis]
MSPRHFRSIAAPILLAGISVLSATPLPVEPWKGTASAPLPGGEPGALLAPGQEAVLSLAVPALTVKEQPLPEGWRGIVSIDVHRSSAGKSTETLLEAFEPATGTVFATSRTDLPAGEPLHRLHLEIAADLLSQLSEKRFGLRLKVAGPEPVTLGQAAFCRVNEEPTSKLFGRSNGGLGPDKLGAGLLGFDGLTEHEQKVLPILAVRSGTPAAQAGLKKGDALIAVAGKPLPLNDLRPGWDWFKHSHEAFLGRLTEEALQQRKRSLTLTVLREGEPVELELSLPRETPFASLNPADDAEAAALLADLIRFVEDDQKDNGSWSGDIKRTTLASLALLATGEKKHRRDVKKAIDWALEKFDEPEKHGNLGFWSAGYMMTLFGEWHLQTGDKRVLKPIQEARDWAVKGQHKCKWGMPALGHGPSGLPYDNKSLVAPAIHLLLGEALTQQCGIDSQIWELLMPYMEHSWSDPGQGGHGGMGYNGSYRDQGEFWSRSGLFALAAHLRSERADMRDGMTGLMQKRHAWFRNSHAYGEPGGAWGFLGLNLAAPAGYAEVLQEYAWWFSLAWEPGYGLRFTTPHMGAPYMGEDDLMNCCYALVLQAPKRNLFLTGKPFSQKAR